MPKAIEMPFEFKTRVQAGKVDIVFNSAMVRMTFTPEQARKFAMTLVLKADQADRAFVLTEVENGKR